MDRRFAVQCLSNCPAWHPQEHDLANSVVTQKLAGSVRHQGLPVASVRILLWEPEDSIGGGGPAQLLSETQTTKGGEFTFSVTPGHYYVEAIPDPSTRFLRQHSSVSVGNETRLNLSLQTGSILSGKVRTSGG